MGIGQFSRIYPNSANRISCQICLQTCNQNFSPILEKQFWFRYTIYNVSWAFQWFFNGSFQIFCSNFYNLRVHKYFVKEFSKVLFKNYLFMIFDFFWHLSHSPKWTNKWQKNAIMEQEWNPYHIDRERHKYAQKSCSVTMHSNNARSQCTDTMHG